MTDAYSISLYGEDVAVGDAGPQVIVRDLSHEDFVRYAGASGDFTPNHYNDEYAKEHTGQPQAFAQGMLTAGFVTHMVSDWFGLRSITKLMIRFTAMAYPGDTLTVTGNVTAVDREQEGWRVEAEIDVSNQENEIVIIGHAEALLPSRADAEA